MQESEARIVGQAGGTKEILFFHNDHLGTPIVVTDIEGMVVSKHRYSPFGEELAPEGSNSHTHRFTGHERDNDTGLDYMMARYYGAALGRFLSVDPESDSTLLDPQSWNQFAYVRNNPIAFVDPHGTFATPTHDEQIDEALPGLSKEQRSMVKEGSKNVDEDQSTEGSFKHSMTAPGQSPQEAQEQRDEFVANNQEAARRQQEAHQERGGEGLSDSALYSFGKASHPLTDAESPTHKGFQEWKGTEGAKNKGRGLRHYLKERHPSFKENQAAVNAIRKAFRSTFGAAAILALASGELGCDSLLVS
jgi:RHS repeat-associated protein